MSWREDLAVLRHRDVRTFLSARFISLLGGVISDRLPRHLVLVVANTVSGLTQALAAILVLSGHAQVWQLAAVEAVNGVAAAFVMPALTGILPRIPRATTSVLHDLRVGWTEFVSRQWVWVIVVSFCLLNLIFVACWGTLGPVIADDTFGRAGWGVVSACFGAGLVVGGVLMIRLKPRYPSGGACSGRCSRLRRSRAWCWRPTPP